MATAMGIAGLSISVATGAVVRKIGILGMVVVVLAYIVGDGFIFNQMFGRAAGRTRRRPSQRWSTGRDDL